jgi:hypothetical protein
MSPISRSPTRLVALDRSFEGTRLQEQFLATAFEAALPILRRRPERTGRRQRSPGTSSGRAAQGR